MKTTALISALMMAGAAEARGGKGCEGDGGCGKALVNPCIDSSQPFAKQLWCDHTASIEARAKDAVSRLSLPEKVCSLDTGGALSTLHSSMLGHPGSPRLPPQPISNSCMLTPCPGLVCRLRQPFARPPGLQLVVRGKLGRRQPRPRRDQVPLRKKTPITAMSPSVSFVLACGLIANRRCFQPITTGMSFNKTMWHAVGHAIGHEARALMNAGLAQSSFWAPVVNLAREPRWGRNIEVKHPAPHPPFAIPEFCDLVRSQSSA